MTEIIPEHIPSVEGKARAPQVHKKRGGKRGRIVDTPGQNGINNRPAHCRGQMALIITILKDAIESYCCDQYASAYERRQNFESADDWIHCRDREWPYSFINICEFLDINPKAVRRALKRFKQTVPSNLQAGEYRRRFTAPVVLDDPAGEIDTYTVERVADQRRLLRNWRPFAWQTKPSQEKEREVFLALTDRVLKEARQREMGFITPHQVQFELDIVELNRNPDLVAKILDELEYFGHLGPIIDLTRKRRVRKRPMLPTIPDESLPAAVA